MQKESGSTGMQNTEKLEECDRGFTVLEMRDGSDLYRQMN